jgi:peptide/nickel transport system permease protein
MTSSLVVGEPEPAGRSLQAAFAGQWRRGKSLLIWACVLALLVLVSLVGPFFLQSPNAQAPLDRLQGPSSAHLLGTDDLGRDILSRSVNAGRVSLGIAALTTILAVGIGSALGLLAGFYHGASTIVMRVMDSLMAFPPIVLAIALVFVLSEHGSEGRVMGELLALVVVFVPYVARVVRSRCLSLAARGYVMAARAAGVRGVVILGVHILPNALPTILVQATFVAAAALLADASLSFLGLGVAPPTATWGNMIADGKVHMISTPLFIAVPGIFIIVAVMAFNIAGDGLRAVIDPRARATAELHALRRRRARMLRRGGETGATKEAP